MTPRQPEAKGWILLTKVLQLHLTDNSVICWELLTKAIFFCFRSIQKQNFSIGKILKKDEITSFLTEKLSAKNVNAFTISSDSLHNQSQKRRGANKNPLNDCIESGITREEAHIVTINKKQKVVVTGDSLLSGISELLRNRQVTVTNFPGGTSVKILDEMENLPKVLTL